MKKKIILILLSLIFISAFTKNNNNIFKRVKKYAGENAPELIEIYKNKKSENNEYIKFILENCSANDLAVLTSEFLINDIEYAQKSKEFSYATYPEDIFQHFVLPYRVSQEPLEEWRKQFYETLKPLVQDAESIEEAATIVNLWVAEQMTFQRTHGRDQSPLTTMKRGFGRCEEMMIIYIAAARSVGIPARPASVPYWNFTDNNHAWVEIWTPAGWKYTGAAEPKNSLNEAWFSKTSKRATLITAKAFGNYNSPNTIKQKDNVTTISSIEYYTDSENCSIKVIDNDEKPVENAKVYLYAASYGGLLGMTCLETDKNGLVNIPLGKGTVYVSAFKDGKFASGTLCTMQDQSNIVLRISDNKKLDENLQFLFPLPYSSSETNVSEKILGDEFDLLRDKANLKRKNRLSKQAQAKKFVKYYDTVYWNKISDKDFEEQANFLDKVDELAGNYEYYSKVFEKFENNTAKMKILIDMILEWDTKELIEIPDSSSVDDVVNIYFTGKQKYMKVVTDSLFRANVIHRTWRSAIPPENGWQKEFYDKIKHLADSDLAKTVQNVIKWTDEHIIIEDDYTYTYFSGSLNPLQILNLKNVPEFYRTKLINCILKQLGVPLQWKGRLEFYNGDEFVIVEEKTEEKEQDEERKLAIELFVDGEQVKAEEWKNFLIAKLDDEGEINTTFFEGENDSLIYNATYRAKADDNIYLECMTRNSNGDANIIVKSISENDTHLKIDIYTPREYVDATLAWSNETIEAIQDFTKKITSDKHKVIFILGNEKNEPEERMYFQILEKSDKLKGKNMEIIIISYRNSNFDFIKEYKINTKSKLISEKILDQDFPIVFLINNENEVIFSSKGYQMGIADLILKKIK